MNGGAITLATRRSALARAQTDLAARHFEAALPGRAVSVMDMLTTGDRRADWSLQEKGGKGLFTKELEEALLDGRATLAVHSAKDLPTQLPDGLVIAGYMPRADARDVLVRRADKPSPALIATSSPRRRLQGERLWQGVEWTTIRGNVETRLRKIQEGQADATMLAAAGLARLGISEWPGLVFEKLSVEQMVPAAGQAAIAIECRAADLEVFGPLLDAQTKLAVTIERRFLNNFGGGCQTATAAHWVDEVLHVFHETGGYRTFPLAVVSEAEAAEALPSIIDAVRGIA